MPCQSIAQFATLFMPETNDGIFSTTRDGVTIRAKSNRPNAAYVLLQYTYTEAGIHLPETYRLVITPAQKLRPIRAKTD
jgi:hypothetical protein